MNTDTVDAPRGGFRQGLRNIYHERTNIDFVGRFWLWAVISGVAVIVSLASLVLSGLNLGIDFNGGTQWQLTVASGKATDSGVRDALAEAGVSDAKVLLVGDDGIRVQTAELERAKAARVSEELAKYAGVDAADLSVTDVGPTWGNSVSNKALLALVVFFGLIASYLTFRFEWKMAIAAITAVVH